MKVFNEIKKAASGRAGNMSKRNPGESDADFAKRLRILSEIDLKRPADVYVAPLISEGIAGFYVEKGDPVHVSGFVMANA